MVDNFKAESPVRGSPSKPIVARVSPVAYSFNISLFGEWSIE